jgi:hypothetical protein
MSSIVLPLLLVLLALSVAALIATVVRDTRERKRREDRENAYHERRHREVLQEVSLFLSDVFAILHRGEYRPLTPVDPRRFWISGDKGSMCIHWREGAGTNYQFVSPQFDFARWAHRRVGHYVP